MSFTAEVKHELVRYKRESSAEREAELSALMRKAGSMIINNKTISFQLKFKYADLSRLVYSWLNDIYDLDVEVMVQKDHLKKTNNYEIFLSHQQDLLKFLRKLGLISEQGQPDFYISPSFFRNKKLGKAYLRGFFLTAGSINHPSSDYHFEIRCDHKAQAEDLLKLMFKFQLQPGYTRHKDMFVVYVKDFKSISALLNLMGAEQAQLKYENSRVISELKENVNRRVNFETANLDKTVSAAMEQIEAIETLERCGKLQELPSGLQEIAEIRKKHPYDSLKELGERLDPPLSKSGVNSRMRRIKKTAKDVRGENQ